MIALLGGLAFVASLAYFLMMYARFGRPAGPWSDAAWPAVFQNVLLFTIFALHHSVFARTGLKAALTRVVPPALERTTYVWISSLLFVWMLWAWAPVPGVAWRVSGAGLWIVEGLCLTGLIVTGLAASTLDPLDLAGIRQAFGQRVTAAPALVSTGLYGFVRHPIYLGWVLLVWSMPVMTGTRLVFALTSTLYLVVAVPLEERALHKTFGRAYGMYCHKVRWRILPGVY